MSGPLSDLEDYPWTNAGCGCAHGYLLPELDRILEGIPPGVLEDRVLDLGCGNGSVAGWLARRGAGDVVGVDPSQQGVKRARASHPDLEFHQLSAYDPLREELGTFSFVVSLEVVEHVYDPPAFARTVFDVLEPGGLAVLSTPYHGWLKNVAIALMGRFDDHVEPLRVHGHIKFWSQETLTRLLEEVGFELLEYRFAGRVRPLAKSMIAVARRPVGRDSPSVDEASKDS